MRALGEQFTPAETAAFIADARWCAKRRIKFRHMGRDPKTGFDCAGFLQWLAKKQGRQVWDIKAYGRQPHMDGLRDALIRNLGEPIPLADMRPGDIVLMAFSGEPKHVGVLGDYQFGGLSLIHTYGTIRCVVEHRLDDRWRSLVIEAYRP